MIDKGIRYEVQGGVKNYLGKQKEVKAPVKWKSSPDHPETELAYITKKEKDLLIKSDLHDSLKGSVNRGPSGIISLNGWGDASDGFGSSGNNNSGNSGDSKNSGSDSGHSRFDVGSGYYGETKTTPSTPSGGNDGVTYKGPAELGVTTRTVNKIDMPEPVDKGSPIQNYITAVATGAIDPNKVNAPPLTERDKTFLKSNAPKSNILDVLDPRRRYYELARGLPGAKKSSFKNLSEYRNYLESQGVDLATIDRLMEGVDEENAIGYDEFQELAYDYDPEGITDIDILEKLFNDPTRGPFDKITAVPQNFSEFMLTQKNNPTLFTAGNLGNFMDMPKPKDLVNPNTGELYTNTEWNNLKREIGQDRGLTGGSRDNDSSGILDIISPILPITTDPVSPTGFNYVPYSNQVVIAPGSQGLASLVGGQGFLSSIL